MQNCSTCCMCVHIITLLIKAGLDVMQNTRHHLPCLHGVCVHAHTVDASAVVGQVGQVPYQYLADIHHFAIIAHTWILNASNIIIIAVTLLMNN